MTIDQAGVAAPTVERALTALAGFDSDGASVRNDVGFSKFDSAFGRSLAEQVRGGRVLSPRQRNAAWLMLAKYRTQLGTLGLDYGAISRPDVPPAQTVRRVIDVKGDEFLIDFEFNQAISNAVKAMPDERTWNAERKLWSVKATTGNVAILDAIARQYRFELTAAAASVMREIVSQVAEVRATQQANIEASIAADADFDVPGLGGTLRPFQRAGVAYLTRQRRSFLADDMGIGKTIQGLATIESLGAYPAVVVCPATLKENWRRELKKWLPHRRVAIISGKLQSLHESIPQLFAIDNSADIYIVNYDVLESWEVTLRARGAQSVIFDEAHYVKSGSARRTKAAKALAKGLGTVLCLTGTPVLNRPDELIAPLTIMDRLGDVGGYREFKKRYVDSPRPNLEELNKLMRATCYIRRTKGQVLTELPPKQRSVVPIELDNRREYDRAEADLIAYLKTIDPERAARAMWAEQLVKIEVCKQLAARGKLAQALRWIEDFLEDGNEKLVLFLWHKVFVKEIAAHFKADTIDGDTTLADRDRNVQAFQTDPAKRLIVCNMQAGGVGITLTASSSVAFLELGWTPALHSQAEDRCHRIGQRDTVNAYYLLAPDTIDERIQKLIDSKRLVVDAATDGRVSSGDSILSDLIADLRGDRKDY